MGAGACGWALNEYYNKTAQRSGCSSDPPTSAHKKSQLDDELATSRTRGVNCDVVFGLRKQRQALRLALEPYCLAPESIRKSGALGQMCRRHRLLLRH